MSAELRPQPPGIPLPSPSRVSAPYWDAAREQRLVFQRCRQCGRIPRRASRLCGRCGSPTLDWQESSRDGTLYSWTVVWRPQHPAFQVPYAPAVVEMAEGWWLLTAVIGCGVDDLAERLPLRIEFHPAGDGIQLPYACPVLEGRG